MAWPRAARSVPVVIGDRCGDAAGVHDGDPNSGLPQLVAQRNREPAHRELARPVSRLSGQRDQTIDAQIDNPSVGARLQQGNARVMRTTLSRLISNNQSRFSALFSS